MDVLFPARPDMVPNAVEVSLRPWAPWTQGENITLTKPLASRRGHATFEVPVEAALSPGSYTIWASVRWADGASESVSLAVAVRATTLAPPLAGGQWIQLDFDADRDADALADFPVDLASFGLAGGLSAAVDMRVESWVIREIIARAGAFYDENPSDLPGGDLLNIKFSADPRPDGPYTRICVAGATPGEGSIIGNVLLDPGNQDKSDEACDDYLPSGVFPREIEYYQDDPSYQAAFAPMLEPPLAATRSTRSFSAPATTQQIQLSEPDTKS